MKMSPQPKAFSASERTRSKAAMTSSSRSQRRMPRPPPPAAALRMMGKPYSFAFSSASWPSLSGSVEPGMMGTPQAMAICLAESLSPILSRISEGGPMNLIPAASQARAKSAFSDRKP